MIDTIVIRVHNLMEKEQLLARLFKRHSGQTSGTVDLKAADEHRYTMIKHIDYHATGNTYNAHRNKFYIKSSAYDVHYCLNFARGFAEFQFSIPKYKYGTNVCQFVQHFTATNFLLPKNSSYDFNLEGTYKRLFNFLKNFFDRDLGEDIYKIMKDIEINRFDICFNQVFLCKHDALSYLNHQKGIKQRYERIYNDKMEWETSIYKGGKYFTFKIYHKGKEFEKHDGPQLLRINRKLKHARYNVPKIQGFADRILRYEIEFKNMGLNYLFKNYIFRKNSASFKNYKKSWKRVCYAHKYIKSKDGYRQRQAKIRLNHKDWRQWEKEAELYTQMVSQSTTFTLDVSPQTALSNKQNIPAEYLQKGNRVKIDRFALFSEDLMNLCFKRFRSFFKHNQLTSRVSINNLERIVNDYNVRMKMLKGYAEKGSEVRISSLQKYIQYAALFSEKDMITRKMYSRQAIHELKKKLKALGFSQMPITEFDFKPDNTFESYHLWMMESNLCVNRSW